MNPQQLIPVTEAIPAVWPWFKILLTACFTVHLLFMNTLLGCGIIGWSYVMRSGSPRLESVRDISRKLPFFMAFAINFGVAALLFMQVLYGHLFYSSSILMAVWWLAALALVLMAYVAAYWLDFKFDSLGRARGLIWTLMVASLLLVGFVFSNNMTLMVDPSSWRRYFPAPGGLLWHWQDATLMPRYLHFVTASVAVAGLVLAVIHRHRPDERAGVFMQWFTAATAMQFIIGGWFFVSLPRNIRMALMGGHVWGTIVFAVALLGGLATLAFGIKRRIRPAAGATVFTVLAMVLVRDAVRDVYLSPYFRVNDLIVHPQYSPMVVFGLFMALGVAVVGYMARLYLKATDTKIH